MKNLTFILSTILLSTFAFASFPVSNNCDASNNMKNEISFPISDYSEKENKTFFNKIKKKIKSMGPNIEWGSFFAGFLLGILGVLFVYVFDGDASSAWKGFGAAILLYLVLYLALVGALIGAATI